MLLLATNYSEFRTRPSITEIVLHPHEIRMYKAIGRREFTEEGSHVDHSSQLHTVRSMKGRAFTDGICKLKRVKNKFGQLSPLNCHCQFVGRYTGSTTCTQLACRGQSLSHLTWGHSFTPVLCHLAVAERKESVDNTVMASI